MRRKEIPLLNGKNIMVTIIIDNIYSKLINVPQDIENIIWEKLSFEVKEFQQEYVQIRHLYNRKTKKTYTGLIEYIYNILSENDIEYQVQDLRNVPIQNADFKLQEMITLPNGNKVPLKAREYQQKIIDECEHREIIQAATGAGKTFIMAGLIDKFKVKPTAIFADKLTLCTQLRDEISKFLGEEVGLVGGGINDVKDITVYSAQSVKEEDIQDAKLIMFDECFIADTLITLADNSQKTIKEIVDNKLELDVLTYNTITNKLEINKIYNFGKKKNNKKLYKIKIQDEYNNIHEIICTEDHKIFTDNTYIQVKNLKLNQSVIVNKGE